MTAPRDIEAVAAEVLAGHCHDVEERVNADDPSLRDYGARCTCGQWNAFDDGGYHRAHVAAVLADALAPTTAACEAAAEACGAKAEAALWRDKLRGRDRSGVMRLDREEAYADGKRDGAKAVLDAVEVTTAPMSAATGAWLRARAAARGLEGDQAVTP